MNITTGTLVGKDQTKSNFYLPFSFIITSFLSLFVFSIFLIVGGPLFEGATIRSAVGIGAVHLFILGFATTLAMGAVYQLVPVVTNETLYSIRLGVLHYFLFTTGSIGILIGFFQFHPLIIIGSSILAVTGVVIFLANIFLTIKKANAFTSILFATISSFVYLLLTVVSGLLMGVNFAFSLFLTHHSSLLATHIWFGFVGWFLFLIVGFSFKMLPMFYLAHGYPIKLQKWILIVLHLSLVVITVNFFLQLGFVVLICGLGLFLIALGLYRFHIYQIQQKKFKRNPGKGITLTVYALDAFILFVVISIGALFFKPSLFQSLSFLTAISVLYLFGWVGVTILGYLSKIVPFLWWTFCFGERVGKEDVPSLHQMIDEQIIFYRLLFLSIMVILLASSIYFQLPMLAFISQVCLGLCIIFYFAHILKVFTYS
ncbi:hypothetical protein DS745_18300 [Anaerobacillus alkaliphilus]|uniref:Uncharacterized protein n=1 Tax=Anaerobacillus alkaliphilus TaxID=1548597 RepID=A0A4Q0VQN6_9BACI|nr:hypothetical protein [Anaerobacillus alkaliphilus]RXI98285.1 hypothetical protein DS745_18300 [Anaerobacillus alkaliphilus]